MEIKLNYYLKIKKIMGKDNDTFRIEKPTTFKNILNNYITEDKLKQIDLSETMIISDGKNIEDLDELIDVDTVFSICPKIYGG